MTLDIDLPDFALWLMNLADFLYAHVKGIIISDQLWPREKKSLNVCGIFLSVQKFASL